VAPSVLGTAAPWVGETGGRPDLSASGFERALDHWWRRTSFSDITAGAYEARVASEPEEPVIDDEPPPGAPAPAADGATPLPLAAMPAGVEVGTLVHRVLEATDFAAADLDRELAARVAEAQARRRVDLGDQDAVIAGLRAAIETPLGPVAGGARLRDVAPADRLDELDFELPLVGGDDPLGPALTPAAIADALRAHSAPSDPLAGYAERLLDPALRASVRGFLTGSIDLVVRLADGRFAIADYKTNRLAPPGEPLTAAHHRPAALAAEMRRSHYALQAVLYLVALHRYLRWRLPGYSPDRNLAGVLYLFLRGMTGADAPVLDGAPCGVFGWRPPAALVERVSDVLDRGGAPMAAGADGPGGALDRGGGA